MCHPKVIVGEMHDNLLRQIVEQALTTNIGANVVARNIGISELEKEAVSNNADIVVLGLKGSDLPPICERLLDRLDRAVIVGVVSEVTSTSSSRKIRMVIFHSGDLEPTELADAILTAMQKSLRSDASPKLV